MTAPADLAEVRAALALVAQATPGPWKHDPSDIAGQITASKRVAVAEGDTPVSLGGDPAILWNRDEDPLAIVALRNAAPAIAAAVEELERLRADNEALRKLFDENPSLRVKELAAARAEIASLEVDVKRHLKSFAREREIAMQLDREVRSLRAELAAACAVPADVEAAIASLDAAAYRRGRDPVKVGGPPSATAAARVAARAGLRAAIAKAIADAEERARTDDPSALHDVEAAIDRVVRVATRDGMGIDTSNVLTSKPSVVTDSARAVLRTAIAAEIERARAEGRAALDAELRRAVELRAQAVREAHSGALAGLEEAARLELEDAGLASYGDSPETTAREAHIFAVKCVKRAVAAEARLREIEAAAKETDDAR